MYYQQSDELEALALRVLEKHPELEANSCRIAYLYADKEKKARGKAVYADTEKVSEKVKSVAPFDFLITFYRPNCEWLDDKRMALLMYHELRHVGYDEEKDTFRINPHDVEDFRDIIHEHGPNWLQVEFKEMKKT